ncbi:hypothetical protein ACROYT_G010302 [Oculina patagonica]
MCLTPRGIQNLNNTSFANSVLQAVLSVERFSKGLESIQHNREKCSAKRTGKPCIVCSTKSFITAYKTAPGLVHPSSLMGMLPSINCRFQKGQQQCAAEFFQEFCRVLGYRTSECQNNGFIPKKVDLSFLKIFFFNLRSEVVCLGCNNVTCNSTMETLLPLHLVKDYSLQQLIDSNSKPIQLETPYTCYKYVLDHTRNKGS